MCTNHLKKKYYSEAQALQWAIHIAKGLKYLHSAKPKVSARLLYHSDRLHCGHTKVA